MKQAMRFFIILFVVGFMGSKPAVCGDYIVWIEDVTLSGAVEVEYSYLTDYADVSSSDINLATAELGVEATLNDWTTGFALFSWDPDGDDGEGTVLIDEAHITLGNTEKFPLYMTTGMIYIPFGVYESNMISDPLTMELGEIRHEAFLGGYSASGFYTSVYAFNGDADERWKWKTDTVQIYGVSAGYSYESEGVDFDIGADWISNVNESNGLWDMMTGVGSTGLEEYVPGYAAHVIMNFGPMNIFAEYVAASDDIQYYNPGSATIDAPSVYAVELGYTFEMAGKETTFSAGYQGTENCLVLGLPESRIAVAFGVGLAENVGVTLEYAQDTDYETSNGGTGESATAIALQLALEF
jgi:hypothetical protein